MSFAQVYFLEVLVAALLGVVTIYFLRRRRMQRTVRKTQFDSMPFGVELAQQIAELLEQGLQICLRHRDYCGMGLRYYEGNFLYGDVSDGELFEQNLLLAKLVTNEREVFSSRESFIFWLATQTNHSLRGSGNQRLTPAPYPRASNRCCTVL